MKFIKFKKTRIEEDTLIMDIPDDIKVRCITFTSKSNQVKIGYTDVIKPKRVKKTKKKGAK